MYKIKTSELLSGKGIDEKLTSIEFVKNISDDSGETKHYCLMVAYSLEYKIEFSFDKANSVCKYIMVEENYHNKKERQNGHIEFIDDIHIMGQHIDAVKDNFNDCILKDDSVVINNIELFFNENKVDSLYYIPKQNIGNNHLNG